MAQAFRDQNSPPDCQPDPPEGALAVNGDVVPCEAHYAVAGQLEVGVAVGVALAIATRAVELEAVELDGEPLVGPKGVHFVRGLLSLHCSIEGWGRNVRGGLEEGLEAPLQEAFLGARLVGGDRPAKRAPLAGRWRGRGRLQRR
jgi:hypothetical protein